MSKLDEAIPLLNSNSIDSLEVGDQRFGTGGAIKLADALKTNTSLTTLYIQNNQIGSKGAKAIAKALGIKIISWALGILLYCNQF